MADVRDLGFDGITVGLLGVVIAIGLWWLYFDLVSHRVPIARRTQHWLHLHLPLVIAIAAGGAAVLNTVEHVAEPLPDAVRWLLVGSLAASVLSIVLLTRTLQTRFEYPEIYRAAEIVMLAGALMCLAVGLAGWGAKESLTAMVAILLAPVAAGLVVWLKRTEPDAGARFG